MVVKSMELLNIQRLPSNQVEKSIGKKFEDTLGNDDQRKYVRLGFNYAGYRPDPNHPLSGEGRRLRPIKAQYFNKARQPAVRKLIQAAWDRTKSTQ